MNPDTAIRPTADVLRFLFNFQTNTLGPGTTSYWFYVVTDATSYQNGLFTVQDGITYNINAYAPIPVPPTALLLGTGLLGLVGFGYRRKRKS